MSDHCPLALDRDGYTAVLDGRNLDLTYSEFEILYHLAASPGRVFSTEQLYSAAWGEDAVNAAATARVCVYRIRKKLGAHSALIETVRKVGYRFAARGAVVRPAQVGAAPGVPPGVVAGLAGGIAAAARALAVLSPSDSADLEALKRLHDDPDVRRLVGLGEGGDA